MGRKEGVMIVSPRLAQGFRKDHQARLLAHPLSVRLPVLWDSGLSGPEILVLTRRVYSGATASDFNGLPYA